MFLSRASQEHSSEVLRGRGPSWWVGYKMLVKVRHIKKGRIRMLTEKFVRKGLETNKKKKKEEENAQISIGLIVTPGTSLINMAHELV